MAEIPGGTVRRVGSRLYRWSTTRGEWIEVEPLYPSYPAKETSS